MRIAPISNNLNYRKTNKPSEKQESAGKTGMSLPSFRDAKSLVNVSFKGERELFQAVYFKDFEKINNELRKGTDINCHKAYNIGETPLICSVVSHFPDVAEVLLENPNIDVNATENNGYTALAIAAIWNYPDMAQKILEHPDVDVNIKDCDGRTAYDRAQPEIKRMIETYQPGVDRRKSARGRNSSSQVSSTASAVNKKDENGRTALHLAAKAGDSNLVRTLLDTYSDIDINAKDNWNNTPLMLTTFIMDDGKTAEQLLKRSDIDVNAKNNLGNTALIMAVKACNIPMVKKILERPDVDLKIEDSHGSTALYYSVTNGEIHNLLNEYQRNTQSRQTNSRTNRQNSLNISLLRAAREELADEIETLLQNPNIDVNAKDEDGNTALIWASYNCNKELVEKILEHPDVDVNIGDSIKNTASDWALSKNRPDIAEIIQNYQRGIDRRNIRSNSAQGTDINAQDSDGRTALHRAVVAQDVEAVEELLQNPNIDVNIQDIEKYTPLMHAANEGNAEIVEKILRHPNIDVNKQNKTNSTALIIASANRHTNAVAKILEHPDVDISITNLFFKKAINYANPSIREMINSYVPGVDKRKNAGNNSVQITNVNAQDDTGSTALMDAAFSGDIKTVNELLKNPYIDINLQDNNDQTALIQACKENNTEIALKLLERPEIKVNLQTKRGDTALIWAVFRGNEEIVDKLLSRPDVDITPKDDSGRDALYWATTQMYPKIKEMLRDYRLGIYKSRNISDINAQDSEGRTALHRAVEHHDIEGIDKLLQNPDVDVNLQDNNGNTALIWAASRGRKNVVEKLLQRPDIDVNLQDQEGNSALLFSSKEGYTSIVEELLKHPDVNINIKNNYGNTALKYARARGYAIIANLIETYERGVDKRKNVGNISAQGTDINAQDSEGRTALHRAVEAQDIDEVERLIQNPDVNVNLKDKEGCTALIRASYKRDASIVEKLLQRSDIDVNAQGNGKNTALIWASYSGIPEVVDKLLEHPDIDIRLENFTGRTAFEWARKEGHFDMAAKILNYERGVDKRKNVIFVGPDINAKDKQGFTPLLNAVDKNNIKEVEKLLQNPNVDVNAQTPNGNTALMIAANRGEVKIVKKILEHPDVDIYIKNKMRTDAISCASITTVDLIKSYQRGVDNRKNISSAKKGLADKIQVDINKLSPEENIWSEEEINKKFLSLLSVQRFDDAIKMLESTPLINLEADNKKVISRVCMTGNPEFVEKVFEYRGKQDAMKADYDKRRSDFLENKIKTLSYDELKENPIALHTEDGFKILMSKPEFNPNDTIDKKSLFDFACDLESKGTFAKQILSKYDDVDISDAKKNGSTEIKALAYFYENVGKYQIKFDTIKRNMANPETRALAAEQLKDFINSKEFKPDMTDSLGNSALHIAATMADDSARGIIQKLIDKGIEINAQNITNQNALISAIKTFRITESKEDKTKLLSNIKFLLDKGIDVNEPDNNGQTAFHHACSTTSVALLSMILSKEPNVFIKDKLNHKGSFYLSTPQMKEAFNNYIN